MDKIQNLGFRNSDLEIVLNCMYTELTEEQIRYVAEMVKQFV